MGGPRAHGELLEEHGDDAPDHTHVEMQGRRRLMGHSARIFDTAFSPTYVLFRFSQFFSLNLTKTDWLTDNNFLQRRRRMLV